MAEKKADNFSFEISLSVLNHLGRNLYRSFVTVLGEAVSNSWDADAKNVWVYINNEDNSFTIKDDGIGMTAKDFQDKFLKIGYSKRRDGVDKSPGKRPFIGRKGIGKLALLSCADKITVISKTKTTDYIGGVIDNSGLDKAINNDLTPQQYSLGKWDQKIFAPYTKEHEQGTIIYFQNIKGGIKNSLSLLKKIIALYFRFSLIDKSFNIYIDGAKVSYEDLNDLAKRTEFLWIINQLDDPYIQKLTKSTLEQRELTLKKNSDIQGFIASVKKPRDLTIMNIDERVSVDLFVNGRLREKDILKHIPTARIVEDYLYGQIHVNYLDDNTKDRFTSDREGVVSDDSKYQYFLTELKENLKIIIDDWDKWRRKNREDGDIENVEITPKERKSEELFNVVSGEYTLPKDSVNKDKIDGWVNDLFEDAKYNFSSYAECFLSENLVRKYITEKKIDLSKEANDEVKKYRKVEVDSKNKGNISIVIRKNSTNLSYLDMNNLAYLADMKDKAKPLSSATLSRDADEYKPMRDAVAHTALLTDEAKKKLSSVYDNIKGRIKNLFSK